MSGWQQPILTSNGTWGVDDFAVRGMGDRTYLAFDGTTNYLNGTNTDRYIEIWIKDGLALGDVVLTSSDGYLPTRGIIAYSDDGETYTDCGTWSADNGERTIVVCTNHDVHKYFRLTFKSACDYESGNADISDITLIDYATSISTTPVALTFDGKTNYAKIPVSLTDTADWSAEITFETDGKGSNSWSNYQKNCLFGQNSANDVSGGRDFHIDVMNGNLYIYHENKKDKGYELVDTKINVADGKQHTVKIVSNPSDNGISVYCDGVYTNTVYIKGTDKKTVYMPTPFLGWNGHSKRAAYLHFSLHSFKLTKNGAVVAEYAPTEKEVALKTLTDKSENGNDATLYGNIYEYKTVDILFNFLTDTSRAVQATTAVDADTCRVIAAHLADFDFSADTARTVHRAEIVGADTGRTVQTVTTINADAARKTVLPFEIDADTNRTIAAHLIDFNFSADTNRTIQAETTVEADAARKTVLPFAISVDTRRQFGTSFSIGVDTSRTVQAATTINADISRAVEKTIAADFDATRAVQVPFTISADTTRKVIVAVKLDTDTLRTVERTETVNGDALRYLIFDMDKLLIPANQPPAQGDFTPFPTNPPKAAKQGVISMTLELATGTLSDTLNFETFGTDFTPKRAIRGTFLDFPYEYLVEQVTSIGKRQTVTCMNQIDQKKYAKVDTGDLLSSAVDVAKKIADSLGMKLETYHEKFTVTTSYSTTRVTASNMMSGLYSWTQNLPWRKINVFFRDKTMYVVQRGYEPREPYDITALYYPEPTITQAVYRNQYSGSNKQSTVGKNAKTKGFSGSITYPNGGYTNYDDGQPTDSVKYQNGIRTDTWWSYDGWGRMTHQIVDTKPSEDFALNPANENANDTHSEIRIDYYGEGPNGSYEVSKTTTVTEETDRKTGKTTKTTTVNYSEAAPGSTSSTTINSDGGVSSATGSTLLQTNSDFARNQYNTVSCGGKPEWIVEGGGVFDENTITDFPLNDTDGGLTLGEIAAELNAYDRCIQETLQIELVEPVVDGKPTMTHIVDFLERVKFRGNEYYLERNEIERTTREIKQTITAVRWEGNLSEIEKGGGTP